MIRFGRVGMFGSWRRNFLGLIWVCVCVCVCSRAITASRYGIHREKRAGEKRVTGGILACLRA